MVYSVTTPSPSLIITSTSKQQQKMTQGFIDRLIYKLMFKPLDLNNFHKVTEYVIRKVLSTPYINLKLDNCMFINNEKANQGVKYWVKQLGENNYGEGKYQNKKDKDIVKENLFIMNTLKVAIRDSKNVQKVSQYNTHKNNKNLWYFK